MPYSRPNSLDDLSKDNLSNHMVLNSIHNQLNSQLNMLRRKIENTTYNRNEIINQLSILRSESPNTNIQLVSELRVIQSVMRNPSVFFKTISSDEVCTAVKNIIDSFHEELVKSINEPSMQPENNGLPSKSR